MLTSGDLLQQPLQRLFLTSDSGAFWVETWRYGLWKKSCPFQGKARFSSGLIDPTILGIDSESFGIDSVMIWIAIAG